MHRYPILSEFTHFAPIFYRKHIYCHTYHDKAMTHNK